LPEQFVNRDRIGGAGLKYKWSGGGSIAAKTKGHMDFASEGS